MHIYYKILEYIYSVVMPVFIQLESNCTVITVSNAKQFVSKLRQCSKGRQNEEESERYFHLDVTYEEYCSLAYNGWFNINVKWVICRLCLGIHLFS
jgi:hypothetical protein